MSARLALTFDYHPQAVAARNVMSSFGIYTATYYAWYPNIVTGTPTGEEIASSDLTLMKQLGWENWRVHRLQYGDEDTKQPK